MFCGKPHTNSCSLCSSLANVIGTAERQSLSSFAVSYLEKHSKPVRIAIDISIWLFQLQASKAHGANPSKILLYRLIRLCSLPIHAVFVFDGPARPQYKRGKLIADPHGGIFGALLKLAKKMLDAFQMPYHNAPGEAEAECALLQRSGVVDAVMTEDIDAIMFGSTVTIMNFTRENPAGTRAATHVTIHRMVDAPDGGSKKNISMDRGGMILFALLSGGDYIPAGVPKCGRKVAQEIVDAGFGAELLSIFEGNGRDIDAKLANWRERLQSELHDNPSGFFKNKHKAIVIPDVFPDRATVLDYVTPLVSTPTTVDNLRYLFQWDSTIDVSTLLQLAKEDLRWNDTYAVVKLTNMLGPSLLTQRLLMDLPLIACFDGDEETNSVRVCNEKPSTTLKDVNELRLEYLPTKVVGLEVDAELIAPPSSSQQQQQQQHQQPPPPMDAENEPETLPDDPNEDEISSQRPPTKIPFDPKQKQRAWILEPIAKLGLSDEIREWRAKQRPKREATEAKASRSGVAGKKVLDPSMRHGELLRYGRIVNSNPVSKAQERISSTSSSRQNKTQATSAGPTSTMTPATGAEDKEARSGGIGDDSSTIRSSQLDVNQESLLNYNYRSIKPGVRAPRSPVTNNTKPKIQSSPRRPSSPTKKHSAEAGPQYDDSINDDDIEAALLEISDSGMYAAAMVFTFSCVYDLFQFVILILILIFRIYLGAAKPRSQQGQAVSARPPRGSDKTANSKTKPAKKFTASSTSKRSQKNTITAYTIKTDENAKGASTTTSSDAEEFEFPSLDSILDKAKKSSHNKKTPSSRPTTANEVQPPCPQKKTDADESDKKLSSRQSARGGN